MAFGDPQQLHASAREEIRENEKVSNNLWSYTQHARDVRLHSLYVTAFRCEGESRARATLSSLARAHTYNTQGLLMSASQSGNFSTSRRVMHEPRGASRLYCPINQNEPGMATAALSAALRSESLFRKQRWKQRLFENSRPWPAPFDYQGRKIDEETTQRHVEFWKNSLFERRKRYRVYGGRYFVMTFITSSTTRS